MFRCKICGGELDSGRRCATHGEHLTDRFVVSDLTGQIVNYPMTSFENPRLSFEQEVYMRLVATQADNLLVATPQNRRRILDRIKEIAYHSTEVWGDWSELDCTPEEIEEGA